MSKTHVMGSAKINLLPAHIIDQIKAGEVIERPSALLKELIENSIDATSSKINIHIIDNGLELISIEDNGEGICYEDLPIAFQRHATSKINKFEDIYSLNSFGFRGEALASIASVSRLTCTSYPINRPQDGGKCTINGGILESHFKMNSSNHGTTIFIRDLFFNTPARLKFIKSKTSEKNAIKKILNAFLLSNPEVTFSIKWDHADKEIFPCKENRSERISSVIFKNIDSPLCVSSQNYNGYKVTVYSYSSKDANSIVNRGNTLFINGRFFQDNVINKVIQQQTGPDTSDDSKCNIIYIEAPKAEVDINVHPNKTSVKFLSISIVLSLINDCLKQNVYDTNNNGISLNTKRIDNLPTKSSDYFIHGHNQEFVEANGWSSNISQITDEFFLLEQNNQKYIVSKTKLLTNFLTNKWIKQLPIEPHNTIPLLISTPFNCERDFSKEQLQAISNLGFEFSKIDTKKYLLKSYPEVFPLEFAKVIAEMVLNNKSTPTILSEQFNLSIQTISNVFEQTNLTNQEKSFYKLLTNDSIKSFLEVEKKNE